MSADERDPDGPYFRVLAVTVVSRRERTMTIRTNLAIAGDLDRLPGVSAATSGPAMPWLTLVYLEAEEPDKVCLTIVQMLHDAVATESFLQDVDIEGLWKMPLSDAESEEQ